MGNYFKDIISKEALGISSLEFEEDFIVYIWHLTPLYLIHPFFHNDVPNSSSGETGNDAEACGRLKETKTKI